ncbi:MAG: hypothetical protein NT027_16175 [Proteobacteria bacterium]|nr:hypothetical protein [Pseudomonadota bacterium]
MKQLIQVATITILGFSACASKKNASVSELESVKKSKGILNGKLTEYQIDEAIPARKVFSSNVEVNFQSKNAFYR